MHMSSSCVSVCFRIQGDTPPMSPMANSTFVPSFSHSVGANGTRTNIILTFLPRYIRDVRVVLLADSVYDHRSCPIKGNRN